METNSQAKLARAAHHLEEVDKLIVSQASSSFYDLSVSFSDGGAYFKISVKSGHKNDQRIVLAAGDAISNMRSALDYAVVALSNDEEAQFPNGDDQAKVRNAAKSGKIGKKILPAVDFFAQTIQPYKHGKGENIWKLNKLRNIDKHRFLLATVQLAGVKMSFQDGNGNVVQDFSYFFTAESDANFMSAPTAGFQFTSPPEGLFRITIDEAPYFEKIPLRDVLRDLYKSTAECVTAIESFKI